MTDSCGCPPEAGNAACDFPAHPAARPSRASPACPLCGQTGKAVSVQTVKAMLAVSLRDVRAGDYFFCRTAACPVVYFSADGERRFTRDQLRERVFQKEPGAEEAWVCYCFRHTAGEVRAATPEAGQAILDDINAGIQAGQCACELRNPQGACCLGNVRDLMRLAASGEARR